MPEQAHLFTKGRVCHDQTIDPVRTTGGPQIGLVNVVPAYQVVRYLIWVVRVEHLIEHRVIADFQRLIHFGWRGAESGSPEQVRHKRNVLLLMNSRHTELSWHFCIF